MVRYPEAKPVTAPGSPEVSARVSATGKARRAAFGHLFRLLHIAEKPRWATPALIGLGIASSFAETMGITLVVLFLYTATGQVDAAASAGGFVGGLLGYIGGWFGSTTQMAGAIFLLIVARGALSFANNVISAYVGERISETTRNLIHEQYLTVSYPFMQRHAQAQLMEVLGTESWLVAGAYASLTRIIISLSSILVFAVFLVALSWQITAIALVGSVIISLGLRRLSESARELGAEVKRVHQQLGEHMLMTLQGLRTIRAYGLERIHQRRFRRSSAEARKVSVALARLSSLLHPLTEAGYLAMLGIIIVSSSLWGISFAITLAAVALLYRLQPHAHDVENNLLYVAQIEPQLRSLRTMLEKDDKEYATSGERSLRSLEKHIRFERVTFRHEGAAAPVLEDVTFTIPAGVTTAIVGASGAGKTTIINLLLGLYRPSSGTIYVDDLPIDEIKRADWLGLLAVSGQDVDLIEGTVAANLRMARSSATEEDVVAAARAAGVADFIEALPERYDTWIGQQGLRFSGGQRQRLGLARALLRNAPFLMLDEAMSELDRGLENRIRRAIEARPKGTTVLLITHRLETVLDADHIVCIEDGRIAAVGAPCDLLTDVDGVFTRALAGAGCNPVR